MNILKQYCIFWLFLKAAFSSNNNLLMYNDTTIKIGLIYSMYEKSIYNITAEMAINKLRNEEIIPENVLFEIYYSNACTDNSSLAVAIDMWNVSTKNVAVVFGPECDEGVNIVALVASIYDKPIFGYTALSEELIKKARYQTMSSVSYAAVYLAEAARALLLTYNWRRVTIVRTDEADCSAPLSGFSTALKKYNVTIVNDFTIDMEDGDNTITTLRIISSTVRIVILCAPNSPEEALPFLQKADSERMVNAGYVYIVPVYQRRSLAVWEPWLGANVSDAEVATYRRLYRNVLVISTAGENSDEFKTFATELESKMTSLEYFTNFTTDDALTLAPFHDVIVLYGLMLNKSIEGNHNFRSGKTVVSLVSKQKFNGATGYLKFDSKSERVSNYDVSRLDEITGQMSAFLTLGSDEEIYDHADIEVIRLSAIVNWYTADNQPPPAVPICGFREELCSTSYYTNFSLSTMTIVVIIASIIVICSVGIGSFLYFRQKLISKKNLTAWKIDLNLLRYEISPNATKSHLGSSSIATVDNGSRLTENGDSAKMTHNQYFRNDYEDGKFYSSGMYKDETVGIKRWKKISNQFSLKVDHVTRLQHMKELNHENLNKFFGFSNDQEDHLICLWMFCTKRSLLDVLCNEDFHLDLHFQVSIIKDIITGLDYLHNSPIQYHGRLFVGNCLIDSRWIVKLSDFGLETIVDDLRYQNVIGPKPEDPLNQKLCTAPEKLSSRFLQSVKPADVYCFGMIAYQVLFGAEPFSDFDLPMNDILNLLIKGGPSAPRPAIKPLRDCDPRLLALLPKCWFDRPSLRPTSSDLKKEIYSCTKSLGKNLLDHVMSMLEKYATNLEKIVEERTAQLTEERRRADLLLYQMLPKTVANALKNGHSVSPETFECATIYFSDVVGFTSICSKSSPMEVVDMLNSLYSKLDEIILHFDAYKVETIGDAYLVVSGVPTRNDGRHVINIAEMSLQILKVFETYTVPHLAEQKLEMRIGLNSGPVACGVVGLTMPKFCIFGDSVNFASRMESTGQPGKIHMSEHTNGLLALHPEFIAHERGLVDIKGKGMCRTFWLLDKVSS